MKRILLSFAALSTIASLQCMQPAARFLCRSANRLALRQMAIPVAQFSSQPRTFVAPNNLLASSEIRAFSTSAQPENPVKSVITVQNIQDTLAFLSAVETHLRSTGKERFANDIATHKENILLNGLNSTTLDDCFRTLIASGIIKSIKFQSSKKENDNTGFYKVQLVESIGGTICWCVFWVAVFTPAFWN